MFPIRIRKLDNISVRQTYRWKARFMGFSAIYSVSSSTSGLWEISKKSNDSSTRTQMHAAKCCYPWCADSRCRHRQAACIFMNARHGAVLHRPRPGQPAATRPCTQITLCRLVSGGEWYKYIKSTLSFLELCKINHIKDHTVGITSTV